MGAIGCLAHFVDFVKPKYLLEQRTIAYMVKDIFPFAIHADTLNLFQAGLDVKQ